MTPSPASEERIPASYYNEDFSWVWYAVALMLFLLLVVIAELAVVIWKVWDPDRHC